MKDCEGSEVQDWDESAWFVCTTVAVAVISAATLILSVWFSMLGGAAR